MLPTTHLSVYHQCAARVDNLSVLWRAENPVPEAIASQFEELESYFLQEILTLTDDTLEPKIAHQWQVMQTEIHRLLRLMKTDLLFWQMAMKSGKSGKTPKQTQRLQDYLQKLQAFCQIATHA